MVMDRGWIAAIAVAGILAGLLLILGGQAMRRRRGLECGRTVSLDNVTLTSRRYGLTGRPDRLIRQGGTVIPEEWKSAHTLRPWHRAQLGVYFLLIEEQLGVTPPYGFLVGGDGSRQRLDNDAALRAWVFNLAEQIRAARAVVDEPIPVRPAAGQCRPCGMRGHCGQGNQLAFRVRPGKISFGIPRLINE